MTVPLTLTATVLILASAGCAQSRGAGFAPAAAMAASQNGPPALATPSWWQKSGDPVLATLVEQGLDSSQEIACSVAGLRRYNLQTAKQSKRIGEQLGRLLGANQTAIAEDRARAHEERVQRVLARRVRLARQVALAYVEVRRLQQEVAVRSGLDAQFKDNAAVARFRREAGLVSAIDGALAGAQDQAAQGELSFAQIRLSEAMSELARLTGNTTEALAATLGPSGTFPDLSTGSLANAVPGDGQQAALAETVQREASLTKALAEARRTVTDARGSYRQGAGDFATLYVAEAAATSVNLALINARASRVAAAVNLLSGQDNGWARDGLEQLAGTDVRTTDLSNISKTTGSGKAAYAGKTITVIADCD